MHLILSLAALAIALGLADQLLSNLLLLSPAHTRHSAHEPQGLLSPGVQTAAPGRACQGPGLAVQVSDTGGCTSQARGQPGCCREPPIVCVLARPAAHIRTDGRCRSSGGRGGASSGLNPIRGAFSQPATNQRSPCMLKDGTLQVSQIWPHARLPPSPPMVKDTSCYDLLVRHRRHHHPRAIRPALTDPADAARSPLTRYLFLPALTDPADWLALT